MRAPPRRRRAEEGQVGRAGGEPPDVERHLAQVVVAPLARFAAWNARAGRHVVPAVGPVIDRVQQQAVVAVDAEIRTAVEQRVGHMQAGLLVARAVPPARR